MRAVGWLPVGLLLVGAALIGDAIARGGATLALVVVIPVVFGASVEFFAGVVVLFFAFVTLPLAFGYSFVGDEDERPGTSHDATPPAEVGGLILIGPVPIFFGGWRNVSRRIRIAAAVLGGVLLGVGVVLVLVVR